MIWYSKKQKIRAYLAGKQGAERSAFDDLLGQWLSDGMQERLNALGLIRVEIHIDWLPEYRCIGIQGRKAKDYVDVQIEPESFFIARDRIEPDEGEEYPLESAEQFYRILAKTLCVS